MATFVLILSTALWSAAHSFLASLTVKDFIKRWLGKDGERSYRLSYNIFSVVTFAPIALMVYTFPDKVLYSIPEPWVYPTTILQGLAGIALIAAVMQTDVWEFVGFRQIALDEEKKPNRLVTSGLYSLVRHPIYTFGLLFIWLSSEMTVNRLTLFAVLTIYVVVGIIFEERKLVKEYGDEYQVYRSQTPMLIPRLGRKS